MFAVENRDGTPVRWALDGAGATATPDPDYEPALLVAGRGDRTRYLDWLVDALASDPKVTDCERVRRYRTLAADERSPLLRVSVERLGEVRQLAREIRRREYDAHAPGTLRLYDVDLDPGFRYCLDQGFDPTPSRELRRLSLSLPDPALGAGDLSALRVDGDPVSGDARAAREAVTAALEERDPDVLVVSSGDLIPLLAEAGIDPGRRPGYTRLAGESAYVRYGQVGHSPARYAVPGRAVVDRSSSFLLGESGFPGLLYLVERAGKPLQELARDSIGGVLTAIEVRAARRRGVPAPWQKRQTERWKSLETLAAADRGGFTFQPSVGVHEDVHELDFASLYPNVIREYNVSPETVCCDCHDRADVPELGYSVCDDPGFLGQVLAPLLEDRARWKRRLRAGDDPASENATDEGVAGGDVAGQGAAGGDVAAATDEAALRAKVDAVKWVLVSCFGYQGYRHAKFGRIEVHEAINAYAREILLRAKEIAEDAGWRVVHGVVDSLWLTPVPDRDQRPIRGVAADVTDAVDIPLEHEGHFEWLAVPPRKRASGAALMRYFGRWTDGGYKLRGIEARQRSTCAFVARAQRDLVAAFDRERDPGAVCDRLARHLAALRRGAVSADDLAITQRVSRRADEYERATLARAALVRAADRGRPRSPGQSVTYVVVDADANEVRLAAEDPDDADRAFYADRLVRACASVVAPLGWDEARVRQHLADARDARLSAFGE